MDRRRLGEKPILDIAIAEYRLVTCDLRCSLYWVSLGEGEAAGNLLSICLRTDAGLLGAPPSIARRPPRRNHSGPGASRIWPKANPSVVNMRAYKEPTDIAISNCRSAGVFGDSAREASNFETAFDRSYYWQISRRGEVSDARSQEATYDPRCACRTILATAKQHPRGRARKADRPYARAVSSHSPSRYARRRYDGAKTARLAPASKTPHRRTIGQGDLLRYLL